MTKALDAVKAAKIDPHWAALHYLRHKYEAAAAMTPQQRDLYELVENALKDLIGKIPAGSDLGVFPRKWLCEFRPYVQRAMKLAPPNDGRTAKSRRAAFSVAKAWGWRSAAIAGVFVLTGTEKIDANRDFKTIKDKVRKAFARFLKSS